MEMRTAQLFNGLRAAARASSVEVQLQRVGSMFGIIFAPHPVRDFKESQKIDAHRFAKFFHYLLNHGVYLPPSSVDAACVSASHSEDDIEETVSTCAAAFASL
jgi:glutamate-1-semialdehyde 2,1-aminomutase